MSKIKQKTKKMKTNCTIIFMLFFTIFFTSCKKENVLDNENLPAVEFLKFENFQEFSRILEKVSSMNEQERKQWEDMQGFRSFGSIADEIYKNANPENFETREEFFNFVNANLSFLEIYEDETGIELNPKLVYTSQRYLIGEDHLFQIGNFVYKIFDGGTAIVEVDEIQSLKNLSQEEFLSREKDLTFDDGIRRYYSNAFFKEKKQSKDIGNNVGMDHTTRKDNGNDRTLLRVSGDAFPKLILTSGGAFSHEEFYVSVETFVRPYKKTLGIWYHCTRTITVESKVAIDYRTPAGPINLWRRKYGYLPQTTTKGSVFSITPEVFLFANYVPAYQPQIHFAAIYARASTPSTGAAILSFNPHLF